MAAVISQVGRLPPQSEGYTDYVIDCYVRRLLGVSGCGVAAARRPPSPLRDRSRRVAPSTLGV